MEHPYRNAKGGSNRILIKGLCNNYLEGVSKPEGAGIGEKYNEERRVERNILYVWRGGITFFIPFHKKGKRAVSVWNHTVSSSIWD